jgi:hypothetical protein
MPLRSTHLIISVLVLVTVSTAAADGGTGVGTSLSYSTILATHGMRSALPTGPEVYGRFYDLFEAGVFGTYGSGTSSRFESYWSVVAGAEARFAPAGRFYMPYAGLGISYAFHDYAVVLPNDHMVAGYVSIAPLRFTLRPLFAYKADVHPIVSVLQIRYGPIYYDGGKPSWFDMGNFVAVIDLVRVGVFFGL